MDFKKILVKLINKILDYNKDGKININDALDLTQDLIKILNKDEVEKNA
jgi:hypothetical protein